VRRRRQGETHTKAERKSTGLGPSPTWLVSRSASGSSCTPPHRNHSARPCGPVNSIDEAAPAAARGARPAGATNTHCPVPASLLPRSLPVSAPVHSRGAVVLVGTYLCLKQRDRHTPHSCHPTPAARECRRPLAPVRGHGVHAGRAAAPRHCSPACGARHCAPPTQPSAAARSARPLPLPSRPCFCWPAPPERPLRLLRLLRLCFFVFVGAEHTG
jgi:hypothetical protein